jgi:hypothetical protein
MRGLCGGRVCGGGYAERPCASVFGWAGLCVGGFVRGRVTRSGFARDARASGFARDARASGFVRGGVVRGRVCGGEFCGVALRERFRAGRVCVSQVCGAGLRDTRSALPHGRMCVRGCAERPFAERPLRCGSLRGEAGRGEAGWRDGLARWVGVGGCRALSGTSASRSCWLPGRAPDFRRFLRRGPGFAALDVGRSTESAPTVDLGDDLR